MQRTIFHLDLDSFFVAVERIKNPSLIGKPCAVGGNSARSVISSASYEARSFGVRSAMPSSMALKKCPQLILLNHDFKLYSLLSDRVFTILENFTPLLERISIDEAYLDMTGSESLFGSPLQAAEKMKKAIFSQTKLSCSIGIASNRLVAKVATDFCKPNGIHQVLAGQEAAFLAPLNIEKLPGCGKSTQQLLNDRGIITIKQLQEYPQDVLEKNLGSLGRYLHQSSHGQGSTDFFIPSKTSSISKEHTFKTDILDLHEIQSWIQTISAQLGSSIRKQKLFTKCLRIKLRYPPFETTTRSMSFDHPIEEDKHLYEGFLKLFLKNWDCSRPLRLIGLGCVLTTGERQFDLFEDPHKIDAQAKLEHIKDAIQKKFGEKALRRGPLSE